MMSRASSRIISNWRIVESILFDDKHQCSSTYLNINAFDAVIRGEDVSRPSRSFNMDGSCKAFLSMKRAPIRNRLDVAWEECNESTVCAHSERQLRWMKQINVFHNDLNVESIMIDENPREDTKTVKALKIFTIDPSVLAHNSRLGAGFQSRCNDRYCQCSDEHPK